VRVYEEPFLSREAILSVYRPGELTTDRPFRTLRQRHAASSGRSVIMRTSLGQVIGRIHLYSALNADAARAYRLGQASAAQELAARAGELERSTSARVIERAIAVVASHMPVDLLSNEAPATLRRYLHLRRRSSWRGLDVSGLAREWLVHSGAWLTHDAGDIVEAVSSLSRQAEEARADVVVEGLTATTFFGVIQRMDATAAEVEGADGQALLVPRDDLDRQGLAALGQPIALLREILPGGGSYCLPMPAVAVDPETDAPAEVPVVWETAYTDGILAMPSRPADAAWLDRELAREPTALPAAPLPVK
jgi:hypothetical protein